MNTNKIFYKKNITKRNSANSTPELCIDFKLPLTHFNNWQKCSILANFAGEYIGESFKDTKKKLILAISSISNELIENAVKFSTLAHSNISLSLYKQNQSFIIKTKNISTKTHLSNLKAILNKIKSNRETPLFLEKITYNNTHNPSASEIGIISLIKDYNVKIDGIFTPIKTTSYYQISLSATFDSNELAK